MDQKFWNRVKNKTNVDKESIIGLAKKLNNGNMKNEDTLREVIDSLLTLTGREMSDEKKQKIIDKIVNDNVPSNVDKMF